MFAIDRRNITKMLSELLEAHIDPNVDPRIYWAKEVTFDYGSLHQIRVDYMLFKPVNNTISGIEKGDVYCYEVKSSIADFNSKNGHNFIGDFNYYIMPEDVYESVKEKIPWGIGVYIPDGNGLRCIKKAYRNNRDRPIAEILLMMWRSSRRAIVKQRKEQLRP